MDNRAHFTIATPETEEREALRRLLADLDQMTAKGWLVKERDGLYSLTDAGWEFALGTEKSA